MSIAATMNIKYVTDTKGRRKEVIVPYHTWKNLTDELESLKEKEKILFGLRTACREVKKQEREEKTLDEFLDEL